MGGGAAEAPVIHQERSRQAQEGLDRQECDLTACGDRRAAFELAELLPRLTGGQVQELGKLCHRGRLLLTSSPKSGMARRCDK